MVLNSEAILARKELLREAAKAQIRRWCKPHKKRSSLDAPDWVVAEWKKRPQAETAQILLDCNFDKVSRLSKLMLMLYAEAKFVCELEIFIKMKDKVKVTVIEEWCSEKEMKDDHSWSQPLTCTHADMGHVHFPDLIGI